MNRTKAMFAIILPAAVLAISTPAAAQQSDAGWYIGGAYGMSSFNVDTAGITNPSVDDSDSGFKIYGGFQFNKHFGAEIGYADFGKSAVSGSALGFPFTASAGVTAWTFAGVGTLPLNESFSLFGKVGLANWKVDVSANVLGASGSDSDSGTDAFFGIGARYNLNKNWGLVLEYEQYSAGDWGDATLTSLGVRYKF
jgi:OmpA-OmpF porin, OOP family